MSRSAVTVEPNASAIEVEMADNKTQVSAESTSALSIGVNATATNLTSREAGLQQAASEPAMAAAGVNVTTLSLAPLASPRLQPSSPTGVDQSAAASVQTPMLAEMPNKDEESSNPTAISSASTMTATSVPSAAAEVAQSANNSNIIAIEEPPDDEDGQGQEDAGDEQQEEATLGASEDTGGGGDQDDLLSRRLFGAEEFKKLRNHRAKLLTAQNALSRRGRRRKKKQAKTKNQSQNTTTRKTKNKKRASFLRLASKSTQTRQGSTTIGYDGLNGEAANNADDLITLALTESPITSSLRQHFPSLVNPLQLPSAVQKLFASSKLSSQLRGHHHSSGNRYLQQQQQLSSLLAQQQQASPAGATSGSNRLADFLSGSIANLNWGDSTGESSALGSAVLAATSGQDGQQQQRDKMIPVEIIGLDPAVTNSILEGAADPAQLYEQQSSSEDQASAHPASHHHHHHHHQQQNPLHLAAKGAPQVRPQQHMMSATKAHPSIIHIHHFHTQASQQEPSAAGQSLLTNHETAEGQDAPAELASSNEASESNAAQQEQQQANDKDELTHIQMDEQGGNNRTQTGASSSAEQDRGGAGEQQLKVINGEQQEMQAQQEQQTSEQQEQLVIGSQVGQSNLSHSSHLPASTAAASTNPNRNEANNSTTSRQQLPTYLAAASGQQQVSIAEGQSSMGPIGRVSLARGVHNAPTVGESDNINNNRQQQQQMLMVAYKPQQVRNSTTLNSASPLVFSGNYFPLQQQQQQQQQHSPFNEGQESMSSHSLALAKQLTAGGQQPVRSANLLLGRPFNAASAAPTAPNFSNLSNLGANRLASSAAASPETLLFEQLSPAELAALGLSSEQNSSAAEDSFVQQQQHRFQDMGSGRLPLGSNSTPKTTRPSQQSMLFDLLSAGKQAEQQLALANGGNPNWPPTAPYASVASSNSLFGGQQQNLIGNLALLRQMQQANLRNSGNIISKNLQATRANNSLTKLTNEELLALLNGRKSTGNGNSINATGGHRNARPSNESSNGKQLASSSAAAANKFELAQASSQLPPKYMKSQLVGSSSANNATTIAAHNGYQQQQQQQMGFNSKDKDHKSSGVHLVAIGGETTTHHNSQRAQLLSGQQLNKHQPQHHQHGSQAPTIVGAESSEPDESANGLGTIGLAFIFAVSLLTLTIIAASMIYRHRRRSVGRCADLAGRSRLNLTQRTKHFMRANFVSPSDVTSIKSISTEVGGASSATATGQSAAVGCKAEGGQGSSAAGSNGGKQQLSFIDSSSNLRGQQQHDAISRYTCTKQSFGGQTATLSTFSGSSEKYQVFAASRIDQTMPTQADIKTLNTRLQRPSYLRTLISSQESLNGVGSGKHSRLTQGQATDRVGGAGCYLNIRHRSANLLGAGKHLGSRKQPRSSSEGHEGSNSLTACRRSHSFQKLNCDLSQNHRDSLKGPNGGMATIQSVSINNNSNSNCNSTTFLALSGRPRCQSPPNHQPMMATGGGGGNNKHLQSGGDSCYRSTGKLESGGGGRGGSNIGKLTAHQDNFAQIDGELALGSSRR